jgi:DNA-directed RNA polymerase subunit RPC12/RpoP
MRLIDLRCPSCGAEMKVNPDLEKIICIYCGKEMLVDPEVSQVHIVNGFDYGYEQERGRLRAQEDFRLEQMMREERERLEAEERKRQEEKRKLEIYELEEEIKRSDWRKWFWICFAMITVSIIMVVAAGLPSWFGVFGVLIFFVGIKLGSVMHSRIYSRNFSDYAADDEFAMFPVCVEPFTNRHFKELHEELEEAGFTNITCRNLHDVVIGLISKEGSVQSVTVSGRTIFDGGKWYPKCVPISITYHGK